MALIWSCPQEKKGSGGTNVKSEQLWLTSEKCEEEWKEKYKTAEGNQVAKSAGGREADVEREIGGKQGGRKMADVQYGGKKESRLSQKKIYIWIDIHIVAYIY